MRTKGDAQVVRHHAEVDQLSWHPQQPQSLAVVPQLVLVLVDGDIKRPALHRALEQVERGEVAEGVAAQMAAGVST